MAGLWIVAGLAIAQDNSDPFVDEGLPVHQGPVEEASPPEPVMPPEMPVAQPEPPPEEEMIIEEPPPEPPRPLPRPVPVRPQVAPSRSPLTRPIRGGLTPPLPRGGQAPSAPPTTGLAVAPSPKDGSTPTEPISFDFHDAALYDVIESISRLTGRNFDVDPNIGATTVTVITHDKIPPELAYQVLESILSTRGFSMVETLDGHLIKIIATPDVTQSEKTPLVRGAEDVAKGYDNYATHIVTVKYADAAELSNALQVLGSKNARITAYAPTNMLIITDTTDGLRRIFSFLEDADAPGNETTMEIFTLEYTRAEALAQQLEQVLSDVGGAGAARGAPTQAVRPPTRAPVRPVPGASATQVFGAKEETLRMVPDQRLNSLIVLATESMMVKVRDLVKRLDTPTPYEANNLHIYELLNADAEQVEQALQPLVGTAPRKAATGGTGGAPAAGGMPSASGSPEIQPFEQKVQITRYDQTNSLLVVASPQDYQLLEAFIARLDVPQRQVLVDAVVMDVTITNDYGVKVDAAGITGNTGFGLTSTSNIAKLAQALVPAANAANAIALPGQAELALGALALGSSGGLTTGIFDDITVTVNNQKVKIPFVPLLLQAIETVSDLEVLSQPSLVTVDNEEASIVVGQEVPFITSTASPQRSAAGDVNIGTYGGYTRVEREEVGVKLTVTPQISEGDNVLLEIEIEVSAVAGASQTVGSVDILGPTTNKSLIKNKVLVKDGATAVLAGLIRDTADRKQVQPPVLGDLPVLGWLFRNKTNVREKRNMVVLVTPHIVKEGIDLDRVTEAKVADYHDTNVEELFQQGFFRKVKMKSEKRKSYRPTYEHAESLTGRRSAGSFGRGDIKR